MHQVKAYRTCTETVKPIYNAPTSPSPPKTEIKLNMSHVNNKWQKSKGWSVTSSRFLPFHAEHWEQDPPPLPPPYIHSVISGNKSRALEAMGGSMKGRKESCSRSWLNRGLSHIEWPVYSSSIMALILWSLLSNPVHPHTPRLTRSAIPQGTTQKIRCFLYIYNIILYYIILYYCILLYIICLYISLSDYRNSL